MFLDALPEYRADWVISGKAASTVDTHVALLHRFVSDTDSHTVEEARRWITAAPTRSMQRKRAQSLRAFGRWSELIGDNDLSWWRQIRVPVERERPQPTATAQDFSDGLQRLAEARDRAILGVLWGAGLRRSEVARLAVADVNLSDGFLVVRTSKTGKPRVAPLPPVSARLVRRHLRNWSDDSLFGLGPDGVRLVLRRHGLLPAHAWRRGWAVESLRSGVSEALRSLQRSFRVVCLHGVSVLPNQTHKSGLKRFEKGEIVKRRQDLPIVAGKRQSRGWPTDTQTRNLADLRAIRLIAVAACRKEKPSLLGASPVLRGNVLDRVGRPFPSAIATRQFTDLNRDTGQAQLLIGDVPLQPSVTRLPALLRRHDLECCESMGAVARLIPRARHGAGSETEINQPLQVRSNKFLGSQQSLRSSKHLGR